MVTSAVTEFVSKHTYVTLVVTLFGLSNLAIFLAKVVGS